MLTSRYLYRTWFCCRGDILCSLDHGVILQIVSITICSYRTRVTCYLQADIMPDNNSIVIIYRYTELLIDMNNRLPPANFDDRWSNNHTASSSCRTAVFQVSPLGGIKCLQTTDLLLLARVSAKNKETIQQGSPLTLPVLQRRGPMCACHVNNSRNCG